MMTKMIDFQSMKKPMAKPPHRIIIDNSIKEPVYRQIEETMCIAKLEWQQVGSDGVKRDVGMSVSACSPYDLETRMIEEIHKVIKDYPSFTSFDDRHIVIFIEKNIKIMYGYFWSRGWKKEILDKSSLFYGKDKRWMDKVVDNYLQREYDYFNNSIAFVAEMEYSRADRYRSRKWTFNYLFHLHSESYAYEKFFRKNGKNDWADDVAKVRQQTFNRIIMLGGLVAKR